MYRPFYLYFVLFLLVMFTGCNSKKLYSMALEYERSSAGLEKKSLQLDFGTIVYLENDVKSTKTLVLLHGFGANKDNWNRFVAELDGKYHVIVPDLAGHGESVSTKELGYTLTHQTEMLAIFLRKKKIKNIHLFGNSMGGAIALHYALSYKVQSLVLIDALGMKKTKSILEKKIESSGINPFFDVCTEEEFETLLHIGMEKPPYIPSIFIESIVLEKCARSEIEKIIYEDMNINADLSAMVTKVKVPTLILWGKKDKVFHVDNAKLFQKTIIGSRVHIFDSLGHVPMLEDSEQVAKVVLPILENIKAEK